MSELKQLELKHIAPYLPYELKALQLDYKKNGNGSNFGVLVGFYPLYENKKPVWHYTFDNNAIGQTAKAIKPLLRPMSDLVETIVHNGEIVCVAKVIGNLGDYQYETINGCIYNMEYSEQPLLDFEDPSTRKEIPYEVVEILFKYHFDFFDLLKKGLAEPIKKQQWKG